MASKKCSLSKPKYLDAVRALHQTIIALRNALEISRSELINFKTKVWPIECLDSAITALSIENHLLRQKILDVNQPVCHFPKNVITLQNNDTFRSDNLKISETPEKKLKVCTKKNFFPRQTLDDKSIGTNENETGILSNSCLDQNLKNKFHYENLLKEPKELFNDITDKSVNKPLTTKNQDFSEKNNFECLNDALEHNNCSHVLTFPTDLNIDKIKNKCLSVSVNVKVYKSPKRFLNLISESKMSDNKESSNHSEKKSEPKSEVLLQHSFSTDVLDQEVDNIELIFTNEETNDTNLKEQLISIDGNPDTHNLQCQISSFDQNLSTEVSDKELEDDVFNDNFQNENNENTSFQSQSFDFTRENSQVCNSKSDNSVNQDELKSYYSYQDSSFENKSLEKDESFDRFEEQVKIVETDMSKVGIHEVEYALGRRNTCPNPLPYRPIFHRDAISRGINGRKSRPILAHSNASRKESEAQTDISALPNKFSWRSESSLANKVKIGSNFTTLPSKYPLPGSKLHLKEKSLEARRVLLSDIGFTSMVPELSRSADHLFPPQLKTPLNSTYGQFLKTSDLYSPGYISQRFAWNTSPSESHSHSRYSSLFPIPSPSVQLRRCSAPVSPCKKNIFKTLPARVRFANGSLPELRSDWNSTIDSGDSTDSLVEEAEQYLRRSIDCMVATKNHSLTGISKTVLRRASAPEPAGDNIPPQGWIPFLPRLSRDLRLDYWVKVISLDGKVRGGRVRFIGHLISQSDQFVGVQLSTPDGYSDGTYNNRRYFQCEPYHGIFVPFKKVIMGWKP